MAIKQELDILLVEDNPGDRELILAYAKDCPASSFRFHHTARLSETISYLKHVRVDLVLLDLGLPDGIGLESVGLLCKTVPLVPVVVLTEKVNAQDGLEALRLGAQDYLHKGSVNPEILERVIKYAIERHRTKREVRQTNQQMQTILDSLSSRIVLLNSKREVIWVNRTVSEELDLSEGDICKMHCHDVLFGNHDACDPCPVLESIKRIKPFNQVSKDKNKRTFKITAIPVCNEMGEVTNVVEVVDEITERLHLESQLRQAQKMESLGTLAGGIAHDFNNILAAIVGFTELALMKEAAHTATHDYLIEVHDASLRATELVRQILTFSRQVDQEPKPLMVQLIINEALKLLKSTLPSMIKIEKDIAKNTKPVLADPTHIHQVIMNLSTNAMHAMEPDGGTLTVEVRQVERSTLDLPDRDLPEQEYIQIKVSDTGCGVSKDFQEKIFEPYFTTKEIGEGTGLGLSVVHGIVEDCSGKIYVDSILGEGTTFTIFLPAVNKPFAALVDEGMSYLPEGSEHILVVDDEPFIRKLCTSVLKKQGYEITVANDGQHALDIYREHPENFDLILSDVMMPGIRGDNLAKSILQINPIQSIVLMTGYAEKLRMDELKSLGVTSLLQKPVTRKTLVFEVRAALDRIDPKELWNNLSHIE